MTELEIASEIEYHMRREGAIVYAYDSLVASGFRAVYPHGNPTAKRACDGEAVIIDVGCKASGYCSDMTRTFFFGKPGDEIKRIYEVVLGAQEAALDAAKPGISGRELDALARKYLDGRGYAQYFVHGLGHGVGVAVHEGPSVNRSGEAGLVPGNVVTVEPGVYVPKLGGVRIEDMILLTEKGSKNLTNFTKEILVF
jgi:Xaa-Pro aminopeptidase